MEKIENFEKREGLYDMELDMETIRYNITHKCNYPGWGETDIFKALHNFLKKSGEIKLSVLIRELSNQLSKFYKNKKSRRRSINITIGDEYWNGRLLIERKRGQYYIKSIDPATLLIEKEN